MITPNKLEFSYSSFIGNSSLIKELLELVQIVSSTTSHVLIHGESGTGKEIVARILHHLSPRKHNAFVPINCTAIPDQLLESELFGHTKGSFTGAISDKRGLFEEANGGTLFLDEIGDLNLPLQGKLLRVLQDKEVRAVGGNKMKHIDARIISATHRNLKNLIKDGQFREDLYYRLNVVPITVPPLRQRQEDIPLLVNHFISKYCAINSKPLFQLPAEVMNKLTTYSWPGNVRELENVIERLCVLHNHNSLEQLILEESTRESSLEQPDSFTNSSHRPTLEQLEEHYIKSVLREVNNKKSQAAKVLGISRRTLHRKEIAYGLTEVTP